MEGNDTNPSRWFEVFARRDSARRLAAEEMFQLPTMPALPFIHSLADMQTTSALASNPPNPHIVVVFAISSDVLKHRTVLLKSQDLP